MTGLKAAFFKCSRMGQTGVCRGDVALIDVAIREEGQEEEEQVGSIPALPHQRMSLASRTSASMTLRPTPSQHIPPKVLNHPGALGWRQIQGPSTPTALHSHFRTLETTNTVYQSKSDDRRRWKEYSIFCIVIVRCYIRFRI